MAKEPSWEFDADYFTWCNCDWGCPCNFNARPTQGDCRGAGVWRVGTGRFGTTRLDGVVFAAMYWFPGLIEKGNATRRSYIDRRATPAQRRALEAILDGTAGGGFFELFPRLCSTVYPTVATEIEFRVDGPKAFVKIGGYLEAESEPLTYPDGGVILPSFTLPHGIEFKTALATNAKRWWVRDEDMLAHHVDRYGAVAKVRFTREKGCVG